MYICAEFTQRDFLEKPDEAKVDHVLARISLLPGRSPTAKAFQRAGFHRGSRGAMASRLPRRWKCHGIATWQSVSTLRHETRTETPNPSFFQYCNRTELETRGHEQGSFDDFPAHFLRGGAQSRPIDWPAARTQNLTLGRHNLLKCTHCRAPFRLKEGVMPSERRLRGLAGSGNSYPSIIPRQPCRVNSTSTSPLMATLTFGTFS